MRKRENLADFNLPDTGSTCALVFRASQPTQALGRITAKVTTVREREIDRQRDRPDKPFGLCKSRAEKVKIEIEKKKKKRVQEQREVGFPFKSMVTVLFL